jgi:hypothetical protein
MILQFLARTARLIKDSYKPVLHDNVRVGTKIAVNWLVFSGILIVWLVVGIPWLTIFYPSLGVYAPNISSIIIALIGGASVTFSTTEIRKTIENVNGVKSDSIKPKGE